MAGMVRRSWVRRSLIGLAAAIVVAAVAILWQTGRRELATRPPESAQQDRVATSTLSAPTPASTATPSSNADRIVPGTLLIPRIGVKAPIEQVTVDSHNNMAVPAKPTDVGWYAPGVAPGQAGDAVIDGHLDWYGMPKAVFYNLGQLQRGDEVDVISQAGVRLRFQVTNSTSVSRTSHPAGLFATTGPPRITLITCEGTWDSRAGQYTQRLLVDASYLGTG